MVMSDGHSYERADIEAWLRRSTTSPLSGLPLDNSALIPNRALKQAIELWRHLWSDGDES